MKHESLINQPLTINLFLMKRTIQHIIIILAFCFFLPLEAQKQNPQFSQDPIYQQMMRDPNVTNFYAIKAEADSYFQNRDRGRGSGYKQYKRWEQFVEPRLSPSGELINIAAKNTEEYEKYVANFDANTLPANYDPGYWTSMGPDDYIRGWGWNGGLGRVNCIAFHPWTASTIYAGTPAGGLWKYTTSDGWEPLTDGLPIIGVSGIAVHHTNPNIIYILTGDGDGGHTHSIGVLKTTNGGITWQPTNLSWNVTDFIRPFKLLQHPTNTNIQYIVSNAGIHKTTDGWQTHTLVKTGLFFDIEFRPGNPSIMYATNQYDFYKSTDSGDTWNIVTNGLPTSGTYRIAIGVTPAHSDYVYLLYGRSGNIRSPFQGLYRSYDGGNSFGLKSSLLPNLLGYSNTGSDSAEQYSYDLAIAVSPTNHAEVHVGGINCWKSTNYGSTWTITSWWDETGSATYDYTHADIHALEFSPLVTNHLYCGSDGGVFRTTDGASNWDDHSDGLVIMQFYRIGTTPQDYDKVVGGTQDNGGNRLDNGVLTHDVGADGFSALIDYTDKNIIYQSTQGKLYRSNNNGSSFTNITPPAIQGHTWDVAWTMHPNTPTTMYVGQMDIYRTTNSGSNWTALGTGNANHYFNEIAIAPTYTSKIYAISNDFVFLSTNSGSTWSSISAGLPASPDYSYISVDPTYSAYVYMSFYGYEAGRKVYRSVNSGTTWSNWSGTLPNVPVNCIVCDNTSNDGVYIGTDIGVFYRDKTMSDWVPYFNQLPNVIVNEMEINTASNILIAGTYGRGLWKTDLYGDCNNAYYLTDANNVSTSSSQYYAADSYISSTRNVYSSYDNITVKYRAGVYVSLNPGFRAHTGAKFEALIGPCSSTTINANQFKIIDRISGGYNGSYSAMMNTK